MDPQELLNRIRLARERDPSITDADVTAWLTRETNGRYDSPQALVRAIAQEQHGDRAARDTGAGPVTAGGERMGVTPRGEGEMNPLLSTAIGAGQGASFGFGDEILAGLLAMSPNRTYKDEVEDIRGTIQQSREDNPIATGLGDVAGGLAVPGAGAFAAGRGGASIGRQALRMALAGGAEGAVAGAGYADGDAGDRMRGAAVGGTAGAALGGALPMVPAAARWIGNRKPVRELLSEIRRPRLDFALSDEARSLPRRGRITEHPSRRPPDEIIGAPRGERPMEGVVMSEAERQREALRRALERTSAEPADIERAVERSFPAEAEVPQQAAAGGTSRPALSTATEPEIREAMNFGPVPRRGPRDGPLTGSRADNEAFLEAWRTQKVTPESVVPTIGKPIRDLTDDELMLLGQQAAMSPDLIPNNWRIGILEELQRRFPGGQAPARGPL